MMRKVLAIAAAAVAFLSALADVDEVRIEADFSTNRSWRVFRDIQIEGGMADAEGVEFEFRCDDLTAFSSFTIYFQSGKGWYKASLAPERERVWQRLRVLKSDADSTEGTPEGWGKVTLLRFSASRGAEKRSVLQIRGVKAYREAAKVAIIRYESGKKQNSDAIWATKLATTLKLLGLATRQISEADITEGLLDGIDLVALPYNPDVSQRTVDILKRHVDRGGRLFVCYVMPNTIANLIGVERCGSFVPASKAEAISGFLRIGDGLPGQPQFAPQASWRSVRARPKGEGKVVAEWADRNRRSLGVPSLIRTPNALFMSHIWNGGSDADSLRLMRSMVGGLSAGLERGMAEFAQRVESRREELRKLAKKTGLKEGERRLVWCHRPYGYDAEHGWEESVRAMKETGYTDLIANLSWGGLAFYRSDVLPVSDMVKTNGDAVDQCLAACRRYGIRLHVWKVCWRMGYPVAAAYKERMRKEGRTQVSFGGKDLTNWLCPSDPRNRREEIDAMLELARRGVDGVHFDYIRYGDMDGCFCAGCRERFEAKYGKVADWPKDVRKDADLVRKWHDFRCDNISAVVKAVSDSLHGGKSRTLVSAAVFQMQETSHDTVGQDWPMWCRSGWLDFVCPMDYTQAEPLFRGRVQSQIGAAAGVKLYPGIGVSCWRNDGEDVRRLCEQIETVRSLGLDGYTVFDLKQRTVDAFRAFVQ